MKLAEVIHDEEGSEKMFRRLIMSLTPFANYPFKKELWQGKLNPWHMTSGKAPSWNDKQPLDHNYINARLVNDEGENYVELIVVVPLNDKSDAPATKQGQDLLKFVDNISVIQTSSGFLDQQNAIQRSVKVYDL